MLHSMRSEKKLAKRKAEAELQQRKAAEEMQRREAAALQHIDDLEAQVGLSSSQPAPQLAESSHNAYDAAR